MFIKLNRDKSKAFTFINASPCHSHRNIYKADGKKKFSVKKTQLFERSEF